MLKASRKETVICLVGIKLKRLRSKDTNIEINIFGVPDTMSFNQFMPDVKEIVKHLHQTMMTNWPLISRLEIMLPAFVLVLWNLIHVR